MKRILCLALLTALAVLLIGCHADTVPVTNEADGARIDVNRSDLVKIHCAGAVNAEEDFSLNGEEAQAMLERLQALCKKETDSPEPPGNMIHMSFSAQTGGDKVWLGEYTIQDNGVILYMESPVDSYTHTYVCDKSVYDEILSAVQ